MARIFISYRRHMDYHGAWMLYWALCDHFGKTNIFLDIPSVPPGVDYRDFTNRWIASCDVVVAVLGQTWIDVKNANGVPRIHDPNDLVRLEIQAALSNGVPVVPALLDGAALPDAAQLPQELLGLRDRQPVELRLSEPRTIQVGVDAIQRIAAPPSLSLQSLSLVALLLAMAWICAKMAAYRIGDLGDASSAVTVVLVILATAHLALAVLTRMRVWFAPVLGFLVSGATVEYAALFGMGGAFGPALITGLVASGVGLLAWRAIPRSLETDRRWNLRKDIRWVYLCHTPGTAPDAWCLGEELKRRIKSLNPVMELRDVFNNHLDDRARMVAWFNDVVLVIIDEKWLSQIANHQEHRAVISTAIAMNMPVIPVLVGQVLMPSAELLPSDIEELARFNAAEARVGSAYQGQVDKLAQMLRDLARPAPLETVGRILQIVNLAFAVHIAAFAWLLLDLRDADGEAPWVPMGAGRVIGAFAPLLIGLFVTRRLRWPRDLMLFVSCFAAADCLIAGRWVLQGALWASWYLVGNAVYTLVVLTEMLALMARDNTFCHTSWELSGWAQKIRGFLRRGGTLRR